MKPDFFYRTNTPIANTNLPNLQFSAKGIAPDVMSEHGLATFVEANKTVLEEGVYGLEGMMPPPGYPKKKLNPAHARDDFAGTGGAGSFETGHTQNVRGK